MSMRVYLTDDAWSDLFSIYEYIALNSSEARADQIFSSLREHCVSLKEFPGKGHLPPELSGCQRTDLREVRFKPYRIFYRIHTSRVDILAVFDGRRDARSLIEQRMVRS